MSLGTATAEWSLEMLRRVAQPDDDVFLSPVSIAVALGMTYAGAAGNTAKQFNQTLFKGLPEHVVHESFGELVSELNAPADGYELQTANKLFGQQDFKLLTEFVDTLKKHYQSEMKTVDFKTNADGVTNEINGWVEQMTKSKIQQLLAPGILNEDTRLVLVNAVYFKGTWSNKFKGEDTFEDTFYPTPDPRAFCAPPAHKKVDMMHQTKRFQLLETDEVQVLVMPYAHCDIQMFVLLPKAMDGLPKFEETLTGEKLVQLIQSARDETACQVEVALPKFKLECQFGLSDHLAAIGMSDAFDDKADFSRMTGGKDLNISAVIHKAFVEVNEEGSEAAAATAVVMALMCAMMPEPGDPPKQFVANHPFLIVFAENPELSQLFLGRYAGKV